MANAKSTQGQDWFAAQQQYWDGWFETQRKAFTPSLPQNPWADFFKEWQNTVSGDQSPHPTEAFGKCFAQAGQHYMDMMQQFYQGTGQAKPVSQMAEEWIGQMQKFFSGGGKDPMASFDPLGMYASMPGIGYTREKQEQFAHLYQQWNDYERKMRDYNLSMSKVGMEALQKFQRYLSTPPKDKEPLKSLKEVYAKWVDVAEEVYSKYAMTPEYTKLYGEVVNALMAFKKKQNEAVDDMVNQFNLPTRAELDSLHKQIHLLKKEIAALKPKTVRKGKKS